MPPTDEVAGRVMKTIRRVALVVTGAWLLVVSLLAVGFGGPVVLVFYLWLLALVAAVWRLVRARLSFETYALVVMGTLTALILLSSFLGPAMASASTSPAAPWLLLALFALPLALWIWLAVRTTRGR